MSLDIKDHFYTNKELGLIDFTKEKASIAKLRSISKNKTFIVDNLPLTIIAYREYGDHRLWWILAVYNNIIRADEFDNETIKIPDFEAVKRALK